MFLGTILPMGVGKEKEKVDTGCKTFFEHVEI